MVDLRELYDKPYWDAPQQAFEPPWLLIETSRRRVASPIKLCSQVL